MWVFFFDVPPPPFLQQFLHKQTVVSFFNVGFEMVVLVFDGEEVGGVDEILELVSDDFENFIFLLFVKVFYGLQLC